MSKAATGGFLLVLLALVAAFSVMRVYLHSDSFRQFLSAKASRSTGMTGEFAPFRWDGLAVSSDLFEAKGPGPITDLRADGLHTEIGLAGVRRGVWEIGSSSVRRLDVSIDTRNQRVEQVAPATARGSNNASPRPSWLPREVELQGIDVRELNLKAILATGQASASGVRVRAMPAGAKDAYRAEIDGGKIQLPFAIAPELLLDRARLRYQHGQVYLMDAQLSAWGQGSIQSSGEWDLGNQQFALQGNATEIPLEKILNADWAKRINGNASSDFVCGYHSGTAQASGKLTLQNARLTALPLLDALAAYADTRRFRSITLHDARTDWHWQKGELTLANLVLASDGLIRIEGSLTVRGQEMDGTFQLGISPGTLAKIPGAETDVFIAGDHGLLWAPLRITGTLDKPKEDLTDRLMAAASKRIIEQIPASGEKIIRFAQSLLARPSENPDEKGEPPTGKEKPSVREVRGILNSILGGAINDAKEAP
ncbi:MAG: hypothetical protein WCL19_05220 [Verrucomicrobiota bacterium]